MALDSNKAREKIEAISDLPTLPSVATEIIALANSPKTNAADVGKMIEQDQSLTAKVLKLVNSSFYGFPGQIRSIQHAVVIIGFNKVKNVVVTASVFDLTAGLKANRLDIPRFWQHSLGAAIGAKVTTPALKTTLQPDDAFVGGLMHDLGKMILDLFLPEEYQPVVEKVQNEEGLLVDREKELLGFTHAQVGSWIAEKWKLPRPLYQAIRFHHTPAKAREEADIVTAVHVGNILSRALGIGSGGDNAMPRLDTNILKQYGLGTRFLDNALKQILEELAKAKEFLDLIEGS